MENCVIQYHHHSTLITLPTSSSSSSCPLSSSPKPHLRFLPTNLVGGLRSRPLLKVKASAGPSHCEFSSLNSPLVPRSPVGKFLSGVLQNHCQLFHIVAKEELKQLSDDRDAAFARMLLSQGYDEGLLHRRIAQVKENESRIAIEDVVYLLIFYKFSEIRVHLVPKLSSCLYNGRLEILPSKDWELESIHSLEVLDIIREHVSTVTGLRANSSVTESWATTKIQRFWLARVYVASILYGYFLKSASLRYLLERSLYLANNDMCPYGPNDAAIFGRKINMKSVWEGLIRQEEEVEGLEGYVMGFHAELRSKEAVHLVKNHSHALFGNKETGLIEHDDVIVTSFSSLRRLVLEAVAFGSFLWETEDYIDNVYKLKDHEVV